MANKAKKSRIKSNIKSKIARIVKINTRINTKIKTKVIKTKILRIKSANSHGIRAAAQILKKGGLVAFPTETVYGLGANAFNSAAVRKIFKAKGRPTDNPMIVHVASESDLQNVAKSISLEARKLIKKFWPGPLTLIFEKSPAIPGDVTANLNTVAVRMPSNKIALALIRASGPIAAPSANVSGSPSPTNAKDVTQDLKGRVEMIIDGGSAKFGVESTVLDLKSRTILRPGAVTYEEIKRVIPGVKVFQGTADKPSSPGMKYRHYSPKAELILFEGKSISQMPEWKKKNPDAAVLCTLETALVNRWIHDVFLLGKQSKPNQIAKKLFSNLRRIDRLGYDLILCEGISEKGIGMAVMNRLRKAASKVMTK